MSRVYLIGLVGLGMFGAVANGAITVVERDQVVQAWLNVHRRDGSGGAVYEQHDVHFDTNGAATITPDFQATSTSSSGTLNDTDTDAVLVAEGSGSGYVDTMLAYSGSDLASYSLSGTLEGSFVTGTLAGYEPASQGAEVFAFAVSLSNAAFSFTTDVPLPYSISATQFNTVGTLFSGAQIYLDVNGDKSFNIADGDISIEDFGFSADGTDTRMGVLPASPFEYRVFFGANTFDGTTSDNTALASSGDFTGSFTVVPEPGSLGLLALGTPLLLSRRRPRRGKESRTQTLAA